MDRKKIKIIDSKIFFGFFYKIYQNLWFLYKKYIFPTKLYFNNLSFLNKRKYNEFSKLCEIYGSDKGYVDLKKKTPFSWKPHTYDEIYYNLFNHCKENIKLVFECGIGSNNPNIPSNMTSLGKPGASLKVWRDYFPNAQIFGADIDENILFTEDRISTFKVDQLNEESIKLMWKKINIENFDLIIDDGLHTYDAAISFFTNSFDKLKKNGIFIIEDVHISYFKKILKKLNDFNPEGIILYGEKKYLDNNLIIIRK